MKKVLTSIKNFFVKIGKAIAKGFVVAWKAVSNFFVKLFKTMKNSRIITLAIMQLKDKWNFSFKANKKGAIFKLITYLVVFIVICAIAYLIMYVSTDILRIFVSNSIPHTALTVILTVIILLETISILVGLTKSLYFGKDNQVLVTFPIKPDHIFVSKMIVYFLDALKKTFTLFVPILIAFGIMRGIPAYYYLWILLCTVIFVGFIVTVCGLLSIPTYFIMRFLKKYRVIEIIVALLVVGGLVYGTIALIQIIPTNINIIHEYEKFSQGLNGFLVWFSKTFKPMAWITAMFCGVKKGVGVKLFSVYSWAVTLSLLALIGIFIHINMEVSKPFYTRTIASNYHSKGKHKHEKKNIRRHQFSSLICYEMKRVLRDEKLVVASLIYITVTPLVVLLVNKFYGAFEVREMGRTFIVLFNYLFVLILAMTHNISSSYIFSKDGPSWNINKTIPVNPKESLTVRLMYNFIVSLLIIIPACVIFTSLSVITAREGVFYGISAVLFTTFHSFLSASYDFMHSENKTKADIGSEYISQHETISLVYALIIAVAAFGFGFLLYLTNTPDVFLRIMIFGAIILALELYLYFKRIRALYQEN